MKINYLFVSRLTTNLTLFVFMLFAAGFILWTSDEFLKWDILPDWIDNYAQLIIVIFGFFAFLLVLSSLLSSLAVLAEFAAQQMGVSAPPLKFSRKKMWIVLSVIAMVLVSFLIFHQIDQYREEARLAKNRVEFQEKLNKQSEELDKSLSQIITLFPDALLEAIHNHSVMEKPTIKELSKLLSAISASLPQIPQIALLMLAEQHPYQYQKIWITPEYESRYSKGYYSEKTVLKAHDTHQQFFTQLPNVVEREVIDVLFKGKIKPLTKRLSGKVLDNTEPSSWGVLKYQEDIVALIFLEGDIEGYGRVRDKIFHAGPKTLISN